MRYFIKSRYGRDLYCHHCGSVRVYQRSARLGRFFTCGDCNNSFSIFVGTVFEKTSTDLRNAQTTNLSKRGRGTRKTPVVGIIERESGEVYAQVALPNREGKKLTGKQLFSIIDKVVKKSAIHMTDELSGYRILDKVNRTHYVIDHRQGFVDGDIHTNSIESFWALLKRGIVGSYHHVSLKYLQEYINEYSWRFSNRKNPDIFHDLVKRTVLAV